MRLPSSTGPPGVRVVAAHALGATAVSLPWPLLLAEVWSATGSDTWLGLTGAARLLPYVVLSTAAGLLADRFARATVLRWSAALRTLLLAGAAIAGLAGQLAPAVVLAAASVAVSTPAYPAAVAALPGLAGGRTGRLTDLLVTAEVAAFVVGPAVGGILIGLGRDEWALAAGPVLALASWLPLLGLRTPPPGAGAGVVRGGRLAVLLRTPGVPAAIAVVAVHNAVESAAGVALLTLSHTAWHAGDRGFGVGTAALGFGALAAPLLATRLRIRGSLLVAGSGSGWPGCCRGRRWRRVRWRWPGRRARWSSAPVPRCCSAACRTGSGGSRSAWPTR